MLLHVLRLDLPDLGPAKSDAGVGDENINMVDAVLGRERLDCVARVGRNGGVNLDDKKRGPFCLGQLQENLGSFVVGVAIRGDDGVVGFGKIQFKEALANTSAGAGDKNNSTCHNVGTL